MGNASAAESSEGAKSMIGAGIVAVLAVIAVALRFYTRRRYKTGIAWDDWWILIGLLLTLLEGSLLLASTFTQVSWTKSSVANGIQA
jgi:nitrate reductase gamma subunit